MQQKSWIIMGTIYATLLQVFLLALSSVAVDDKIVSLPGQPQVSFQQYAGYITNDEKQQRALFYYFVEAETEPASKPLVLWLNGGPGCSSVGAGAFCEHGPFKPRGNILVRNDYSWNKEANMLYLESPAGVGFSYSANKSFYESVNDELTAQGNLVFLERWFTKFPEYKNRDFFITGESYGGHYVPQLAQLIIKSQAKFNLKGIAIGNPLLEFNTDFNSRAEFLWSHGLISDSTYEIFTSVCNFSQMGRQATNGSLTPVCAGVYSKVLREIGKYINTYDVSLDVCLPSAHSQSLVLSQLQDTPKIDVCVEDETDTYLNRKDVQEAFHARLIGVTRWSICSENNLQAFYLLMLFFAFSLSCGMTFGGFFIYNSVVKYDMQNLEVPMVPVLGELVKSGIRVLVYSGDQDSVVPLIGTRTIVDGLAKGLGLKTVVPYRSWFEGRQVAGWTQVYGDILSFATIRGASHEAPLSQPKRSLGLFTGFLSGKPLPEIV